MDFQKYSLEPANYSDYRDFLKSRYLKLKTAKNLTLQSCAQRSKMSKTFLQFLLNKKRHGSLDKVSNLAKTLHMKEEEEDFVYLLLCQNASKNPQVKKCFEKIISYIRSQNLVSDSSI